MKSPFPRLLKKKRNDAKILFYFAKSLMNMGNQVNVENLQKENIYLEEKYAKLRCQDNYSPKHRDRVFFHAVDTQLQIIKNCIKIEEIKLLLKHEQHQENVE
jgi:hypothetical protein